MASDPKEELRQIASSLRLHLEEWSDLGTGETSHLAMKFDADLVATLPRIPSNAVSPSARNDERPSSRRDADRGAPPFLEGAARTSAVSMVEPSAPDIVPHSAKTNAKPSSPTARALDVIRDEVCTCQKCGLSASRTNTVFSRGNPKAKLCFIGEAPGADEDREGFPFVGKAGQLLDKMIGAMGLSPENDVYICNIIKCRPPDNRRPTPEETAACFPFLHEQIEAVSPQVIVALGNTAVQGLLETKLGITKLRGHWKLYRGRIPVMPTYHPSYLLRPSAQLATAKREAWEDLQAVMKELGLALPKKKS